MDVFRSKRAGSHQPLDDGRPAKRISTPAGQRLSMIIESTQALRSKSPAPAKANINVTTTSTYCNDPSHQHIGPVQHGHKPTKKSAVVSVLTGGRLNTPRESSEDRTPNGSALSVSVWSDKDAEKFGRIRHKKKAAFGQWNRKRLAIILAVLFAFIIALAVGLAVGLKKKSSNSSPSSTDGDAQPAGSPTSTATETDKPSTPTTSVAPVSRPSGFPVGTYSFITFLDTVQAGCTANNATWACPPNTDYYQDPQKALAVLTWQISGSAGSYKISSNGQDATFGTMFQNEKLDLLDSGLDTERYRFIISRTKAVNMTGSIGDQFGDFECDYGATTIQGSLYTKMAKTYPKDTIAVGNTGNPAWPYALRVEQTVAGGQNVPSCKKRSGEKINDGLIAQDAGTLCSCLYKNWTPAR
ncbi:hypothetical protein FB567DRAFT_72571 [Paraphoma chrysanthemicola]|uniref:Tat pathway signal sequence n=1 Tax=Paraphoma chrysanthemicola TaxID=798071 RepID=A0A8K0R6X5_9PLEO|nr:hypothetical protein FB567DRAFT_72571 [Paraphoma chrysanthemicola]